MTSFGELTPSTPRSTPWWPYSAANGPVVGSPANTCTSSSPWARPTNWMRLSNWSLQKNGTDSNGSGVVPASSASRFRAAAAPCSLALVQCSTRISSRRPSAVRNAPFGQRAQSPAVYTPGTPAESVGPHTTPSRKVRPLPSNQPIDGVTPMPTSTVSASTLVPSPRCTTARSGPTASMRTTWTLHRRSTPLRVCTPATAWPIASPSPRTSGAGRPSSTVTRQPRWRAVAATSSPMKPAPMTTR